MSNATKLRKAAHAAKAIARAKMLRVNAAERANTALAKQQALHDAHARASSHWHGATHKVKHLLAAMHASALHLHPVVKPELPADLALLVHQKVAEQRAQEEALAADAAAAATLEVQPGEGGPVGDSGLFLRYDPSSPHLEWYREKYASVEAWKQVAENQAPGKDSMEAFIAFEAEFLEKSVGEMVVPYHVDAVNEANMTAMLRSSSTIDGDTRVSKVVGKKALGDNANGRLGVLSCIFRITVEYEGGTGPASAIYKTSPLTADFYPLRGLCKGMRSFAIEVDAYNGGLEKNMSELPAPKGYFACCDEEAARFALLLEDLASRGGNFAPGDQVAGLKDEQVDAATVAFGTIAKLHARYFDQTKAKNCVAYSKEHDSPFFVQMFPNMFQMAWRRYQQVCKEHGLVLDADVLEFGNWINDRVSADMVMQGACLEKGDGFLHQTLLHCDYRLDNFFFDFEADGKLARDADGSPRWSTLDYQLVGQGNPGFELAYFFSQSVSTEFRRKHEKELLECYYKNLIAGGVSTESFPWHEFLQHYCLAQGFAFYYAVSGGNGAMKNGDRGKALGFAMMNRWKDAFRDWNGFAAVKACMERMEIDASTRLTKEECMAMIPLDKHGWTSPVISGEGDPAIADSPAAEPASATSAATAQQADSAISSDQHELNRRLSVHDEARESIMMVSRLSASVALANSETERLRAEMALMQAETEKERVLLEKEKILTTNAETSTVESATMAFAAEEDRKRWEAAAEVAADRTEVIRQESVTAKEEHKHQLARTIASAVEAAKATIAAETAGAMAAAVNAAEAAAAAERAEASAAAALAAMDAASADGAFAAVAAIAAGSDPTAPAEDDDFVVGAAFQHSITATINASRAGSTSPANTLEDFIAIENAIILEEEAEEEKEALRRSSMEVAGSTAAAAAAAAAATGGNAAAAAASTSAIELNDEAVESVSSSGVIVTRTVRVQPNCAIGMALATDYDGGHIVQEVFAKSPASAAGVAEEETLVAINGQSTIGLSHTAVCLMLADARTNAKVVGPTGAPIKLAFYPAPERDDEGDFAEEDPARLTANANPLALKRTVLLSKSPDQLWGMMLRDTEGALCQEIIVVKSGSVADTFGIQVGEVVLAMNGKTIVGATHDDVIGQLKASGNTLELTVQRFM